MLNLKYPAMMGVILMIGSSVFAQPVLTDQNQNFSLVQGETHAIVVGISEYQDKSHIKFLQYADDDARLFANYLSTNLGGDIRQENLHVYLNGQAKKDLILIRLNALANSLKSGDRFYFYFSGHGSGNVYGRYYLLMEGCRSSDPNLYSTTDALEISYIKDCLRLMKKRGVDVYLILDACRTNDLLPPSEIKVEDKTERTVGEKLMLGTQIGKPSIESPILGHGLFTYVLVNGLLGAADTGQIGNPINFASLKHYVEKTVNDSAKKLYRVSQYPILQAEDIEDVVSLTNKRLYYSWINAGQDKARLSFQGNYAQKNASSMMLLEAKSSNAPDSNATRLYNQFLYKLESQQLLGNQSADQCYDSLHYYFPGHRLTTEAGILLSAELQTNVQEKINIFLDGKDEAQVAKEMEQEHIEDSFALGERYRQIQTRKFASSLNWTLAANMFARSLGIIRNFDTTLVAKQISKLSFLRARSYFDMTDNSYSVEKALENLQEVIKRDSNDAATQLTLGQLLEQKGDFVRAIKTYYRALALAPAWSYPWNNLGRIYSKLKKMDSAEYCINKAIEIDSLNSGNWLRMGYLLDDLGKRDQAFKYFKRAIELNPYKADNWNGMGNFYLNTDNGNVDSSIHFYLRAIELDSNYIASWHNLGSIQQDLKEYEKAKWYYQKALSIQSDYPVTWHNLGIMYENINNLDSSLFCYKKAISRNYLSSFYKIVKIYEKQFQRDSALCYLRKFGSLPIGGDDYCNRLGILYQWLSLPDSGAYWYKKGIALNGESLLYLYCNLIRLYDNDLFERDSALLYFNNFANLRLKDDDYFFKLGELCDELFDYDSSAHQYKKSIEWVGSDPNVYNNLALFYYHHRFELDSAKKYAKKALSLDSTNANYWITLGDCYLEDNTDSARLFYQNAIRHDSACAKAYYLLANLSPDIAAKFYYEEVIRKCEKQAQVEAYSELGELKMISGEYDSAILYFKGYMGLGVVSEEYDASIINNIANCYQFLKQNDSAAHYFGYNVKRNSDNGDVWISYGDFLLNEKKYQEAIECFEYAMVKADSKYYDEIYEHLCQISKKISTLSISSRPWLLSRLRKSRRTIVMIQRQTTSPPFRSKLLKESR